MYCILFKTSSALTYSLNRLHFYLSICLTISVFAYLLNLYESQLYEKLFQAIKLSRGGSITNFLHLDAKLGGKALIGDLCAWPHAVKSINLFNYWTLGRSSLT